MIPKAIKPDDLRNPVFSPPSGEPGDPIFDKKKKLYDELHGKAVIFNDEGHLVEFTDKMFVSEVHKQKDKSYASLYSGFELEVGALQDNSDVDENVANTSHCCYSVCRC